MDTQGWRLLVAGLGGQRSALWRIGLWSVPTAVPPALSGRLIAEATDNGFLAGRPGVGTAWLGVFGASMILGALGTRQTLLWLGSAVEPLRDSLVRAVVTGTIGRSVAADAQPNTAAVAQLAEQIDIVRDIAGGLLLSVQQVLFILGGAVVGLFLLSPVLLAVILPPVGISLALLCLLFAALRPLQRRAIAADENVAASTGCAVTAIRDVVACGAQERILHNVMADVTAQATAMRGLARAEALRTGIVAMGVQLPVALLLVTARWMIKSQHLTPGDLLGAVTYVLVTAAPAVTYIASTVGSSTLRLWAALDRIADASFVPSARSVTPEPSPCLLAPAANRYDIELRHVTFAYSAHADPILADTSFTLAEGCDLAIVGPSGMGKSTVGEILAGVRHPGAGDVRIGGISTRSLTVTERSGRVALLPQEAYVFSGSLRENLTYLRPGAAANPLSEAVELFGLEGIYERVGGYDGQLSSARLSAGERQLVALARVHLSAARIVILDEATCHLDPVAEERAESILRSRDGSLIVIAHRMSSALRAASVLLLSGSVPVLGTHASLMKTSPFYSDVAGRWQSCPVRENV